MDFQIAPSGGIGKTQQTHNEKLSPAGETPQVKPVNSVKALNKC